VEGRAYRGDCKRRTSPEETTKKVFVYSLEGCPAINRQKMESVFQKRLFGSVGSVMYPGVFGFDLSDLFTSAFADIMVMALADSTPKLQNNVKQSIRLWRTLCREVCRPASGCMLMGSLVIKQIGAGHKWEWGCGLVRHVGVCSALSGNINVGASSQEGIVLCSFLDSMCGHCFCIQGFRVLCTYDRVWLKRQASEVRHACSSTWHALQLCKAGVRSSTCPFVNLAWATAVQG
jgi:hypothetical protein